VRRLENLFDDSRQGGTGFLAHDSAFGNKDYPLTLSILQQGTPQSIQNLVVKWRKCLPIVYSLATCPPKPAQYSSRKVPRQYMNRKSTSLFGTVVTSPNQSFTAKRLGSMT
jgi:hypothetical protein